VGDNALLSTCLFLQYSFFGVIRRNYINIALAKITNISPKKIILNCNLRILIWSNLWYFIFGSLYLIIYNSLSMGIIGWVKFNCILFIAFTIGNMIANSILNQIQSVVVFLLIGSLLYSTVTLTLAQVIINSQSFNYSIISLICSFSVWLIHIFSQIKIYYPSNLVI
jgi:hypothetical protein